MPGVGQPGFMQWVKASKEAVWGVRNPSPADADVCWFRVVGDTNFHPAKTPARTVIRSADSWNRPVQVVSAKYNVGATLSTPLYPTQAQYLLDAAMYLSTPDETHPIPLQNTYTFDHFNGVDVRSYHGAICQQLTLNSSAGPMEVLTNSNWICRSVVDLGNTPDDLGNAALSLATFPQPAATEFPSELPYNHEESSGVLSLNGSPVVNYESFNVTVANIISARHYEKPWIGNSTWCGRDVSFACGMLFLDTSWRAAYEGQSALLALLGGWTRAAIGGASSGPLGPHSVSFNFNGASRVSTWNDVRPLGDVITQDTTVGAYFDVTASTPSDLIYIVDGGTPQI